MALLSGADRAERVWRPQFDRHAADHYVVTTPHGRRIHIRRVARARFRGEWDVCTDAGGRFHTSATLPAARRWVIANLCGLEGPDSDA